MVPLVLTCKNAFGLRPPGLGLLHAVYNMCNTDMQFTVLLLKSIDQDDSEKQIVGIVETWVGGCMPRAGIDHEVCSWTVYAARLPHLQPSCKDLH